MPCIGVGRCSADAVVDQRGCRARRKGYALASRAIQVTNIDPWNGAYSLFEINTPPGEGIFPHRQRYEDEAFWVLEGTYTFVYGERDVTLSAGGYAFVPRGTFHAYRYDGAVAARMLILVTLGGIHERFFAAASELIEDGGAPPGKPDIPRLLAVAPRYGIEIVEPLAPETS